MKHPFLPALFLAAAPLACALNVDVNGMLFEPIDDYTCILTYNEDDDTAYNGDVVVPAEVKDGHFTYRVIGIGTDAFSYTRVTSVQLPATIEFIDIDAFAFTPLAAINLPEGLLSISDRAFNSTALTGVVLPASLFNISPSAFDNCKSLESIGVAEGNEDYASIGGVLYDFDIATLLTYPMGKTDTSFTVPATVKEIEEGALLNSSVQEIILPEGLRTIGDNAFKNCAALRSIELPNTVESLGKSAFSGCSALTSCTLSDAITVLPRSAFKKCQRLASVKLPSGLHTIEDEAFYSCYALKSIVLPDGVTNLGDWAFADCKSLESAALGASLKVLPECAFAFDKALRTLELPATLTTVLDDALNDCSALNLVVSKNPVPPTGAVFAANAYANAMVRVPQGALHAYKSAEGWNKFCKWGEFSGLALVEADCEDAPAEYFDLQGRRISEPERGIYIERRGSRTAKLIK